jgi:predicted GIY-YIG superfamily endonuclease
MKAFVYVISGDHGRQKIGSSDNPRQRIKDLQTGSPAFRRATTRYRARTRMDGFGGIHG